MTESQWLGCTDYGPMLLFLEGNASERKLRLFAVACQRCVWEQLPDDAFRLATEVAERHADGHATLEELDQAYTAASIEPDYIEDAFGDAITTPGFLSLDTAFSEHLPVAILRDVFGNPFRPASIAPAVLTPTVVSIARAAYDERQLPSGELDTHRLAVLADALEDAGAVGELVEHLRGPGSHVRGCFAVDLCMGLT
jgi:hypothetical protein